MSCATERGDFPALPAEWGGSSEATSPPTLRYASIRDERNNGVERDYSVADIDALLHAVDAVDTATQIEVLISVACGLKLFKALKALGLSGSCLSQRR